MSIDFPANDIQVDCGTWQISSAQAFTIAVWFYADAMSQDMRFIMKGSSTSADDHDWMLGTTGNQIRGRIDIAGTVTTIVGDTNLSTGQWYHAAVTYDGSNIRLYLDGVEDVTAVARTGDLDGTADDTIFIGGVPTGNDAGGRMDGRLGEIFVLSAVLTTEEIAALAGGAAANRHSASFEAYYPLYVDVGDGNDFPDYSGNSRHATLTEVAGTLATSDHPPVMPSWGFDVISRESAAAAGAQTVTPGALAIPVATPSPTATPGAVTASVAALAVPVATPVPTVSPGAATLTPSAVAVPLVAPAPTISTPLTVSVSAIAVPLATPAPTLAPGAVTTTPAALAVPLALPVPNVTNGLTVQPASLAITITTPAPTLSLSRTVTPSAVALPVVITAPVISGVLILSPGATAIPVAVVAPTVTSTYTAVPSAVGVGVGVVAPTVTPGAATLSPSALAILLALPAPVVTGGIGLGVEGLTLSAKVYESLELSATVTESIERDAIVN